MDPAVENTLDPAELHDRFESLHDSVIRQVEVRYAHEVGLTATVKVESIDPIRSGVPALGPGGVPLHFSRLTFELAGVSEFRVAKRFNYDFVVVFEARLARLEGDWWLCLDDTPFNPGEAGTVDEFRESEFYLRCTDVGIRWSSLD